MSEILEYHTKVNWNTQDAWDSYEEHRLNTTGLAIQAAKEKSDVAGLSIAVLGAGNGNDLELLALAELYESVDLYDLDAEALERNEQRYEEHSDLLERVRFIDSIDLTSVAAELDSLNGDQSQIDERLLKKAATPEIGFADRRYDVVLSCSILSQIVVDVLRNLEPSDQAVALALAIRDGHLSVMRRLLKPGGTAILISDFVSSDTLPQLLDGPEGDELEDLISTAISEQNFFTGTNPFAIHAMLASGRLPDEEDCKVDEDMSMWLWQLNDRAYCVAAISFGGELVS